VDGSVFVKPAASGQSVSPERTGDDWHTQAGPTDPSRHDQPAAPLRLAKNISGIGRLLAVDLARDKPIGLALPGQRTAVLPDLSPAESIPSRAVSPLPKSAAMELPAAGEPATAPGPPTPLAIDTIVDEIERRLRLEYLRTYGASGGL
jgi:hypothetical protein